MSAPSDVGLNDVSKSAQISGLFGFVPPLDPKPVPLMVTVCPWLNEPEVLVTEEAIAKNGNPRTASKYNLRNVFMISTLKSQAPFSPGAHHEDYQDISQAVSSEAVSNLSQIVSKQLSASSARLWSVDVSKQGC